MDRARRLRDQVRHQPLDPARPSRPDRTCKLPPGPGQDPVRDFFIETFKGKTQAEWVDWFEGMDVCFAPVKNLRDGLDDPQVRARR